LRIAQQCQNSNKIANFAVQPNTTHCFPNEGIDVAKQIIEDKMLRHVLPV
jgi:hypothetical protein